MERTAGSLLLVLAVCGAAVGAPQSFFGLLRGGNHGGHRSSLFGNIINSTAGVLLQPLSFLGGGGHNMGSTGPGNEHGGGNVGPFGKPNSDSSTYRPTSQGAPLGNGINGQTPGTTQNSVDLAIDDIFGNRGQGTTVGHEKGSTPNNPGGQDSHHAVGGPTAASGGQEENTPTAVDLAFQQLFAGNHGGGNMKPASAEDPNNPANNEKESSVSNTNNNGNDDYKKTTPSSVDSAVQDVFGSANSGTEATSSKPTNDTDTGSDGKVTTQSSVDLAILDVFGKGHEAGESGSKSR